jgi:hypothetical protein
MADIIQLTTLLPWPPEVREFSRYRTFRKTGKGPLVCVVTTEMLAHWPVKLVNFKVVSFPPCATQPLVLFWLALRPRKCSELNALESPATGILLPAGIMCGARLGGWVAICYSRACLLFISLMNLPFKKPFCGGRKVRGDLGSPDKIPTSIK